MNYFERLLKCFRGDNMEAISTKSYYQKQIEQYVSQRQIQYLVHFTRVENLEGILKYGIIPRQVLREENSLIKTNDNLRIDGHEDASCLSITFPNYKMFYPIRNGTRDQDWVVIGIEPSVLWEKECAFCNINAASSEIIHKDINDYKNLFALTNMFAEVDCHASRKEMNLKLNETTNPQAEILVFGNVEIKYFYGIGCRDNFTVNQLINRYGSKYSFINRSDLFCPRHDYTFWQS